MRFRLYRDPDPADAGGDPAAVKVDNKIDPPKYTPPEINMAGALPPEYRDKPFFKDKSFVDIIKEHANVQELLGKRPAGIPKDDAPAEEWDKFLGAVKPKDTAEYKFPETDFSKAGKRNAEYEKAVREMAADVGVPKRQFGKFVEKIEGHLFAGEQFGAKQTEEQKVARETEFEALLDKTYQKDKQAVIDRTKKLMVEAIDPALKDKVAEVFKDISNENLFVLTAVLDGIHKKYVAEDGLPPGGDGSTGGDVASLTAEMQKLQASKEYNDFRLPGHDAVRARVPELARQIAALQKK